MEARNDEGNRINVVLNMKVVIVEQSGVELYRRRG